MKRMTEVEALKDFERRYPGKRLTWAGRTWRLLPDTIINRGWANDCEPQYSVSAEGITRHNNGRGSLTILAYMACVR